MIKFQNDRMKCDLTQAADKLIISNTRNFSIMPSNHPICPPEPIHRLVVVDIYENEVDKTAGPYEEQSALYLKCRAVGGKNGMNTK